VAQLASPTTERSHRTTRLRVLKRMALGALVVSIGVLPISIHGAGAQTSPNREVDEAQFVTLINELRTTQGLEPLTVNPDLVRVARGWTVKMKANGAISHNPNLATEVTADWRKLGENVGVGPDVPILHAAFVKSAAHYRNLVDPTFDQIAVTIEYDNTGFYVTEQFMDTDSRTTSTAAAAPKPTASAAPNELALAKPKPKPKPTVKRRVVRKTTPTTKK
jgi:uncharacterized protein YkwD